MENTSFVQDNMVVLLNGVHDDDLEEKVNFTEQFASEVLDFSSQYGSDTSISYTAYNLTGKPSKFPDYGDYPQVFVMKTYGNWWKECPSSSIDYMPQNSNRITSDDYIDVQFEESVYPFRVSIYETYNPGTVVRIWAKNDGAEIIRWSLLYEGEALNVGHVPRIFSPVIQTIAFKTSVLRIEFNHSKSDYYTGIDAVLLIGTKEPLFDTAISTMLVDKFVSNIKKKSTIRPCKIGKLTQEVYKLNLHHIPSNNMVLEKSVVPRRLTNDSYGVLPTSREGPENSSRLEKLPDETILKILGYLDLTTRSTCSKLNRRFHFLANDPSLYTSLSLKSYWNILCNDALFGLVRKCRLLRRLDLSWSGSYGTITDSGFNKFVIECCQNLTHLRLNCCHQFVTNDVVSTIFEYCKQLKEIGLRNCSLVTETGFSHIASHATRLENLDLYRTKITSNSLIKILKRNPNLLHLNIGSCTKITNMDEIAAVISCYNKNVISLDFWKTVNLSQIGLGTLSNCTNLEEVDLGWCLGSGLPIDSLRALAKGCPRLKKLFLTALRGISDKDLEPFILHCPDLEQIDLLGVRGITPDICSRLLAELPKLKLLDLSFCEQISDFHVANWKSQFPEVSIKRSFQTHSTTNFFT